VKRLTKYFFEGLLVLIPFVLTLYVLFEVFIKIDGLFRIGIPGLGFAATVALIVFIGFIASNLMTKRLVHYFDNVFSRLPFIKMIYNSVKDLTGAFVGDKKSFDRPVIVRLSEGDDISVLGFVTRDDLSGIGIKDGVAVYLPQSYNFAGNLIIVPKSRVTPLDAESGEVMALIVSGGVVSK